MLTDHILVDRIWDVQAERFIDKSQLLASIMEADYVLLGETHDNISHHINQAWLIDSLSIQDYEVSVSFEMIDYQQDDLTRNKNIDSSTVLIEALNKFQSSWDYETYYRILFDSVIRADFKIYPANINRKSLKDSVMQGNRHLPPDLEQILSQTPLPPEQKSVLQKEIIDSHCGMLNTETVAKMLEMQRIRDAAMTVSLLNSNADLKLLIAGLGHVSKDHGVPMYLLQENKKASVVSVAPIEVETEHNDIAAYKKHWQDEKLPFDYIWFTARAERSSWKEFCDRMKKRFKGKQDNPT